MKTEIKVGLATAGSYLLTLALILSIGELIPGKAPLQVHDHDFVIVAFFVILQFVIGYRTAKRLANDSSN